MANIVKSKETLDKTLLKELKKVKADLKQLKNRLQDFLNDILVQQQYVVQFDFQKNIENILNLKKDADTLWANVRNDKKVEKTLKKQLAFLYEDFFQNTFLRPLLDYLTEHNTNNYSKSFLHDEEKNPLETLLKNTTATLYESEQKEIRKIFLKIANRLHPDKTTDENEKTVFHKFMQKANEAYRQNDVLTLLEIEEKITYGNLTSASENLPFFEQTLQKKQLELNLLTLQKERMVLQLKELEKSPLGRSLRQLKKLTKKGLLSEVESTAKMLHETSDILENIKNIFELVYTNKKTTPEINDALARLRATLLYDETEEVLKKFTDVPLNEKKQTKKSNKP